MTNSESNETPAEPLFEEISETPDETPKKKRSPVERAIVWGLIAVILVVIAIEWSSRSGYTRTLEAMQNRMSEVQKENGQEDDFSLAQAREMVSGFPTHAELVLENKKKLQYRWFSLFHTYAIQLSMSPDDVIYSLQTDVTPLPDKSTLVKSSEIARHQLVLPDKGLSAEHKDTLILTTDQADCQVDDLKGILAREIVRQAMLMSGREGMGLAIRDGSLRGEVVLIENPELFPLQMITHINGDREMEVDLIRPLKDDHPRRWTSQRVTLPEEGTFEALITKSEELSRGEFVEGLKTMGYQGSAPAWQANSTVPAETLQKLNEWNFIAQFTAVQNLHKEIAEEGESPERLAALVLAYSNLGSLTEYLWNPAHKVFKARALLYAERLMNRTENAPWAVAHRAYARAFAGRHQSALDDLKTIRPDKEKADEKQPPLPAWVDVIEAYCSYQPEMLDKAVKQEETRQLATYVRCLLADPRQDETQMMAQTEQMLTLEPACSRAMDRLTEVTALGVRRRVTEQRLDELWPKLLEKLLESNLQDQEKKSIQGFLKSLNLFTNEEDNRMKIIRFLKEGEPTKVEPSMNCLGQLLHDVTLIHVCRKLDVLTGSLAMRADPVLPAYLKLAKGHPYEGYIASFSSDPAEAKAGYAALMKAHDPRQMEIKSFQLIANSYYKADANTYNTLYEEAVRNVDPVFEDQLDHIYWYRDLKSESDRRAYDKIIKRLTKVSPHMPQTITLNMKGQQKIAEGDTEKMLDKYGDNPEVLTALADRYLSEKNDVKAEETLKRRLELSPDYRTYMSLAEIYWKRDEKDKWKETLETALQLPSKGLDHANIENKLAYYHMERDEWVQALPHARKAARSYSAWGLRCAAECYEGLGNLAEAEKYRRARSQRYDNTAADWYFWCVRTNYGNREEALVLAEESLPDDLKSSNYNQIMERGVMQIIQGSKAEAFKTFQFGFRKHHDGYCALHAALLADQLNQPDDRDYLLKRIASMWQRDFGKAELANYLQQQLQHKKINWNENTFQSLLVQLQGGSPTNFYYFAGKFLEQHGEKKLANTYLQAAATSSLTNKFNCVLASHDLRSKNIEIQDRRTSELESKYHTAKQQLNQAGRLLQKDKKKEAIEIFDEVLKQNPELLIVLMNRGQVHEALKDYAAARADYQRALEIDPGFWHAHNNLAFLYAASEFEEFRDKAAALKHAQQAFDAQPTPFWINHAALAVAYAANGQFEKAIEMQKEVTSEGPDSEREESMRRLRLFKEGQPYLRKAKNDPAQP